MNETTSSDDLGWSLLLDRYADLYPPEVPVVVGIIDGERLVEIVVADDYLRDFTFDIAQMTLQLRYDTLVAPFGYSEQVD